MGQGRVRGENQCLFWAEYFGLKKYCSAHLSGGGRSPPARLLACRQRKSATLSTPPPELRRTPAGGARGGQWYGEGPKLPCSFKLDTSYNSVRRFSGGWERPPPGGAGPKMGGGCPPPSRSCHKLPPSPTEWRESSCSLCPCLHLNLFLTSPYIFVCCPCHGPSFLGERDCGAGRSGQAGRARVYLV